MPIRAPVRPSPYQPRVQQETPRSSRINVVEDYINRRKEAEIYKQRGRGALAYHFAGRPPIAKRDEQSDYEQKLAKIRMDNFNRKPLKMNFQNEEEQNRARKLAALKVITLL